MEKNETLFRILSRQPWWITLLVAGALFFIAQAVFPPVAPYVAIPFVLVAAWIGVQQLRGASSVNAAERLAELRGMSWEEFSGVVAAAYRRQGYEVEASRAAGFDFTLKKGGRVTLVQCRRWKVNQVGVAPVRELADAVNRAEAYNGICIAADAFSAKAAEFAQGAPVTLLAGNGLVELVGAGPAKRRWFGK
jgi:restriction system protein